MNRYPYTHSKYTMILLSNVKLPSNSGTQNCFYFFLCFHFCYYCKSIKVTIRIFCIKCKKFNILYGTLYNLTNIVSTINIFQSRKKKIKNDLSDTFYDWNVYKQIVEVFFFYTRA